MRAMLCSVNQGQPDRDGWQLCKFVARTVAQGTGVRVMDCNDISELERLRTLHATTVLSNEQVLFILNTSSGLAPYTHEFVPGKQDSQILSGFISALSSFMGEMTGRTASQWKTIFGHDATMIVENGVWATGVLAVSRDTTELRSKLRMVVREFEEAFYHLRDADEFHGSVLVEFDGYVRRVFTSDRISERTLILNVSRDPVQFAKMTPSQKFKITKFLKQVRDWQTVGEAAEEQGLALDETIELVSAAYWSGAVYLLHIPSDSDILMPSAESLSILLSPDNPTGISEDTLRVVGSLDGRTPLGDLMGRLDISDNEAVLFELGYLLNRGLVERLSLEGKFSLVAECVATQVFRQMIDLVGLEKALIEYKSIVSENVTRCPWISFLRVLPDGEVRYERFPTLSPTDIDRLTDALETLSKSFSERAAELIGRNSASEMLRNTRKTCQTRFESLLTNVVM